jgi:hypothetical protein
MAQALTAEQDHVRHVRQWLEQLTLQEAKVLSTA